MSKKIDTLRALIQADEIVGRSKATAKTKNAIYKQVCKYATTLVKEGFTPDRLDRVLRSTLKDAKSFAYHKGKICGIIYG